MFPSFHSHVESKSSKRLWLPQVSTHIDTDEQLSFLERIHYEQNVTVRTVSNKVDLLQVIHESEIRQVEEEERAHQYGDDDDEYEDEEYDDEEEDEEMQLQQQIQPRRLFDMNDAEEEEEEEDLFAQTNDLYRAQLQQQLQYDDSDVFEVDEPHPDHFL
jgi:hypothetical protein